MDRNPENNGFAWVMRAISMHAEATSQAARAETNQVGKLKNGEIRFSVENVSVKPLP
jgi:hypothetical protein